MRHRIDRARSVALRLRRGWHTAFGKNPLILAVAALVSIARGQNYIDRGLPPGSIRPIEVLSGFIPPAAWSVLYLVAGAMLLAGLLWRPVFAVGAAGCAVLWTLWGAAFLWAAIDKTAVTSSAHVTGLTFIVLGGAIWSLASDEVDYDEWHRERQEAVA